MENPYEKQLLRDSVSFHVYQNKDYETPFNLKKHKLMLLRGSAYQMTARKQAKTSGSEPLFELSCPRFLSGVTAFASLGERPECCVDFRGQLISLDFFASFFYQEKKEGGGISENRKFLIKDK